MQHVCRREPIRDMQRAATTPVRTKCLARALSFAPRRAHMSANPKAAPSAAAELDPARSVQRPQHAQRRRAAGAGLGREIRRRPGHPHHRRMLRARTLPARAGHRRRRARPAGQLDPRLRLRRLERRVVRLDLPGTGARRFGLAQLRVRAVQPVHVSDLRVRQRRTETDAGCRAWPTAKPSPASA